MLHTISNCPKPINMERRLSLVSQIQAFFGKMPLGSIYHNTQVSLKYQKAQWDLGGRWNKTKKKQTRGPVTALDP